MFSRFFRNRFGQTPGNSSPGSGRGRGSGRGAGGVNKPGSGPDGDCICPQCGKRVPHVVGQRCIDQVCPGCGIKMIRE